MLPGRGVWDPHWTLLQSNWAGRASGMVNRGTLALFGLWGSHAGFSTLPLCSAVLIHFSRVRLFATPLTVARQALLSMGISRQEYWSGLPLFFLLQGIFSMQGLNSCLLCLLHWQVGSLLLAPLATPCSSTPRPHTVLQGKQGIQGCCLWLT